MATQNSASAETRQRALNRLDQRRILITGSTAGLGYELALGLARVGATVILNGRSASVLRESVQRILDEGLAAEGSCFDVTDESAVCYAIAELEKSGIDVLINNAGIQRRASLGEVKLEVWEEVLRTNLTSAMLVSREVVRAMIVRGHGKIINICSLMSDLGRPTTGPYTASKGGLKMLTKAMCADWARFNIQVNAIGPGYFITRMTQSLADDPSFDEWVKQRTPAARWGNPQELVGAAIFFSSDASSFVNGQILYVDGGMSSVL
jgi:gluconate 5-dehydrogenase